MAGRAHIICISERQRKPRRGEPGGASWRKGETRYPRLLGGVDEISYASDVLRNVREKKEEKKKKRNKKKDSGR